MSEQPSNGNGAAEPVMVPLEQVEGEMRALSSMLVERFLLARAMGTTHGGKRDVYGVLGYDDSITTMQYRNRYERGGIAKTAVDAMPTAVWRGDGSIFEDEDPETPTAFEQQWGELNDQLRVWSTLQRAHTLASLNRFSAILIGAPGELSAPLPKGQPGGVLYLRPIGGSVDNSVNRSTPAGIKGAPDSSIAVKKYEEDPRSRRFGLPLTYSLLGAAFTSEMHEKSIHWTRVVHIPARGFLDNELFGPPVLEAVWNDLLNLDKVTGGGAEAFWLRANKGTQFDVDKKMTMSTNPAEREKELNDLRAQIEEYVHGMTRALRTRGVNINDLGSDVADFSSPQDALISLIAGTLRIPKRILMGSEAGSLASDQDRDNWNDQVADCRTDYAHPVVLRPFIGRLIDHGYLVKPKEWKVKWPEEGAMSQVEVFKAAGDLADVNKKMGEVVVTQNEVREFLGYEPFTDVELQQMADEKAEAAAAAMQSVVEGEQVDRLEAAIRAAGAKVSVEVRP